MVTENRHFVLDRSYFGVRTTDLVFVGICVLFLYLHLFILPSTPIYYEMDHVALLNDAWRMVQGEVIYRDFFEFTFPGAHSLYYVFERLAGPKYWIANFLILCHGAAAAMIGIAISRRVIADTFFAYLPSALYLFLGFRWFGIDGEHRMFSPLFAYLAALLLISKRSYARLAAAGVSCAFASFFTQQRGVLAGVGIGLFLIIQIGITECDWPQLLRSAAIFSISFLAAISLLLLPFILAAGPERFYECTVLFLRNYVEDPSTNGVESYFGTLAKVSTLGLLMTAVTIFYYLLVPLVYIFTLIALWIKRKAINVQNRTGLLVLCLVGLLLSIGTLAPNAVRIFQISLPALIAFVWLIHLTKFKGDLIAKTAVVALICFGFVLALRLQLVWDAQILETHSGSIVFLSPVTLERYSWLSEHASKDDYVYETYNANVNFPLGLRNPSRISVLLNSGYNPPEQVEQAIEDLKRTNARYIIWDGAWTPDMDSLADGEKLKPFYVFMRSNYRLIKGFTPYDGRNREIWERAKTPAP